MDLAWMIASSLNRAGHSGHVQAPNPKRRYIFLRRTLAWGTVLRLIWLLIGNLEAYPLAAAFKID